MSTTPKVPKIARVLTGCTSPETAHVQADYPYGFRLRCTRRCWLEYVKGRGFRLCTQTSNPKRAGLVWNAPKKSTYTALACLVLTDEHCTEAGEPAHVTWVSPGLYTNEDTVGSFLAAFEQGLDEDQRRIAATYLRIMKARAAQSAPRAAVALRVTDADTGEALLPEPVGKDHPIFAASWVTSHDELPAGLKVLGGLGSYNPPLEYVGDEDGRRPRACLTSLQLGRRLLVAVVA